jgi:hypothetical protein
MWENMKFRTDRNAGGLLASTIVLTVAFLGALMVALLAFPRDPRIPWLIGGGIVLFILLFVWLLRDRPANSMRDSFGWLMGRKRVKLYPEYEPRLIKGDPHRYGTNHPPTLDEIREVKDESTSRNWVPSNTRSGRRTLKPD